MSEVLVKRSRAGLGLFANQVFNKGDLVIEYTGEKISSDEANRRGGRYLFELNDDWTIDGKGRENIARYINHSCKPNCYPELDSNEEHVFIYAKKKINPGDELTYNYGKMYFNMILKPAGCKCASCLANEFTQ